jgi:hypothetical protein
MVDKPASALVVAQQILYRLSPDDGPSNLLAVARHRSDYLLGLPAWPTNSITQAPASRRRLGSRITRAIFATDLKSRKAP